MFQQDGSGKLGADTHANLKEHLHTKTAEELEEELQEIEKILAAQQKVQNYDVEQICAELVAAHDKIL